MNELTNKTITFGKNYGNIMANKIFEVCNDGDTYLLMYSEDNVIYKIYMEIEEIEYFFKKYKNNKEIDMKKYLEKTYIIKENQEIKLKK